MISIWLASSGGAKKVGGGWRVVGGWLQVAGGVKGVKYL